MDHTADVGIVASGDDLREAFAQAALGLFTLMADMEDVREEEVRSVVVTAPDREALLVAWLNELIYLSEVESILLSCFEIYSMGERELKANCYGEKVNPDRHRLKSGVKAATYHMIQVQEGHPSRVRVILDV